MRSTEVEIRHVRQYMELEAPDEAITHLEKIASERIGGHKHDVWDIHTNATRWWVITNPTNLYLQESFPSMDYALSFHLGLMTRIASRNEPGGTDEEISRLAATWRRWTQAADALEEADEAEEFQAVGMRCRECLISFVREASKLSMVPPGTDPPKTGDFVGWSELIADAVASGERSARIRRYLKSVAKSSWELVSWLTHYANATRYDGRLAVEATQHVIVMYQMTLVRLERGIPDRCPKCSSYKLVSDFRPEIDEVSPYVTVCESCGWEDLASEES